MADRTPGWERRYSRKVIVTDVLVVVAAVAGAQFLRYGSDLEELAVRVYQRTDFAISYTVLSVILALAWLISLAAFDTRDLRIFGTGPTEYKRVINATLATFGTLAIVAYTFRSQIGRGYVFIALPAGLALLLLTRWLWRVRLQRQRQRGVHLYRTLIVGERQKSAHVANQIIANPLNGYRLVGAITERGTARNLVDDVPVMGSYDEIIETIDREQINTLIITSADVLTPEQIRKLNWELENRNVDFIVAAALTDIAGPRIHARPLSGLPLIHIDYPRFTGRKYFTKRIFDLLASSLLLLILSPVMLLVAAAVRLTSRGPALYVQERVGIGGKPFKMIKFRSMVIDAEDRLGELQQHSEGNGAQIKLLFAKFSILTEI